MTPKQSPTPPTFHYDSLAARNRSAGDLARNLLQLMERFDILRAADRETPPVPVPKWWDGYVDFPDWQAKVRGQRRPPSHGDRVHWASDTVVDLLQFIHGKWAELTDPIPVAEVNRPMFTACRESLRNMQGVLSPAQMGPRLRYRVIPVRAHLLPPLPGVWDPEPESEGEKGAQDSVLELAHAAVTKKGSAGRMARGRLTAAKAKNKRLALERSERNRLGRENAEREGRVSSEDLAAEKAKRADWEEQIRRWELAEADLDALLTFLTLPQHPTLRLWVVLHSLNFVFANANLFEDLAQRRAEAWRLHLKMLNAMGKAASDEANARARAGAPLQSQWAALDLGLVGEDRVPSSNEPLEHIEFLRTKILEPGRRWSEHGREALRAGGAKGYDAATTPNALGQKRSIELHTKFQEAEGVFLGLALGVGHPSIKIDKDAARMAELGAWCKRTHDELAAVIETDGLGAPTPPETHGGLDADAGSAVQEDLNEAERHILIALWEGGHTSKNERIGIEALAKAAKGGDGSGTFRHYVSGLGRRGIVESKSGRGGGVWLTKRGALLAKQIAGNDAA